MTSVGIKLPTRRQTILVLIIIWRAELQKLIVVHPQDVGADSGSPMHYLANLGRLELLGIPQIYYEPIRCNSTEKLIPDLYQTTSGTEIKHIVRVRFHQARLPSLHKMIYPLIILTLHNITTRRVTLWIRMGMENDTADANTPVTLKNPAVYKHKISKPDIFRK